MMKSRGFSLMEILIALAILGILAAIALPSYRRSALKANRVDAHITMSRLATLQERYYFSNNQYTGDFADIVSGAASGQPLISDEGHYSIALTQTGGGTGWSLTATAINAQTDDSQCAALTLTSLGARTSVDGNGSASSGCW